MVIVRKLGLVPGAIGLMVIVLAIAAALIWQGQTTTHSPESEFDCDPLLNHADLEAALIAA